MRVVLLVAAVSALVVTQATAAALISVRLVTSTATPAVDQPWRYTLTVRSASGTPLRAAVRLQLLQRQTVVGCWKGAAMVRCVGKAAGDSIALRGRPSDVLRFLPPHLGVQLIFPPTALSDG